jgi:hypothetical protein
LDNQRINTNEAKYKSIKHRSILLRKNLESHLTVANLKTPKEASLKGKLKGKNFATEKQSVKNISGIVDKSQIESKETFPNTSEGTLETKENAHHDLNYSNIFEEDKDINSRMVKGNSNIQDSVTSTKTKSQLSLKSKAYMRTGNIKDLHSKSNNSLDNMVQYGEQYHRHSLPQRPLDFAPNLYQFTPSTNYTIPSSDGKLSVHKQQLNQSMPMHVMSPVPFGKMESSSQETFTSIDNAKYLGFSENCHGNDMFSMSQYPYYNTGSTGRMSNRDFKSSIPPTLYYEDNTGKSWPKIPQQMESGFQKYSTFPIQYKSKHSGRVVNKENDQQKWNYQLNLEKIMIGKDKRTSLMIRNIPNKYNQTMLTQELDEQHKGLYDFIYLPIDPKNKCNCGYAFINVVHPAIILSLFMQFNDKSWRNFNSEKICKLSYGRLQGKDQLLKQLEGSGVMQQSDSAKKPLILESIQPSQELLEKIKNDFIQSYGFPSEMQQIKHILD